MSEATIRLALKNIIVDVLNIGTVHDYERWSNEWPDFLTLFKTTIGGEDVIRGWTVGYNGQVPEAPESFAQNAYVRTHTFAIRGFLQLDDP